MGRGSKMQSTTATLQKHPKTAIKPRRRGRPWKWDGTPKVVPPTPETALNARPDFIQTILATDTSTQPLAQAAGAIDSAYHTLWARSMSRAASCEPRVDGRREAEDYSPKTRALVLKYRAWLDEVHRRKLPADRILSMIVENLAPYEVDMLALWPAGRAREILIEALEIYCRVKVPEA